MLSVEIKKILSKKLKLHLEDYIGIQEIWDKETEILCRDMAETINFIENECDDKTFCWIGEVFEDVADRTQSKEFIAAIKKRAEKVIDAKKRRSVETDIRYAEYKIDDE